MKGKIITAIVLIAIAGFVYFLIKTPGKSGRLDSFATCLKDSGAVFYGAFWCPHCHDQKALFGRSVKNLPYVECSTPDGQSQKQECTDKGVKSYPTWEFQDGSRRDGVLSLQDLSDITSCVLPEGI